MQAVRFVLVWGLTLALAACGKGETPAPAPAASTGSEPAGKVLAVDGEVTARRAAEGSPARPLAVDAPVWGDDTVVAAAGASLRVLLAHNGVTWTFEGGAGGATRRVDASVAWRAAKGSGAAEALAKAESDRTASAGRHTEGEAAGTVASVEEKKKAEPPPPSAAAAAPEPRPDSVAREEAPPSTKTTAKPKQVRPPKPRPSAADEAEPLAERPPPPPPAPIAAPAAPVAAQPAPAAPAPEIKLTVVDAGPGLERDVVQRRLRRSLPRMRACIEPAYAADLSLRGAATVRITIELSGAARVDEIEVAPRNVSLATCLGGALAAASFPAPTARMAVTFRLDYAPAP